jgi:hypothetical protein
MSHPASNAVHEAASGRRKPMARDGTMRSEILRAQDARETAWASIVQRFPAADNADMRCGERRARGQLQGRLPYRWTGAAGSAFGPEICGAREA